MLISVVIPVYNVSDKLLTRSIQSVLQQCDDEIEIIIVDDGSREDKAAVYKEICEEHSKTRYIAKVNSGPSAARNYGVKMAQGEYVLFIDADDYITDNCINQAKEEINKYHPDIIFGYVFKDLSDEGTIRYKSSTEAPQDLVVSDEKDMASLLNHILGYEDQRFLFEKGYLSDGPCCRFFRKSLFAQCPFDILPRWNEDTLWNIELLKECKSAVICKSMWYVYAVRKGSAMQGFRSNCYSEFTYITEKVSSVGNTLWSGTIDKGIAYRVWNDIFILSRAFIFHPQNNSSFFSRFKMFRNALRSEPYQRAINTVDFHFERRKTRRIVKEMLNLAMKLKLVFLAYLIIRVYVKKQ